jgi:HEAT repeat protein
MTTILALFERSIAPILWAAVALAVLALCTVIVERAAVAWSLRRRRRLELLYRVLLKRALDGDLGARRMLIASPPRHRLIIAALLITPLIEDRDPDHIARTREIVEGLALVPIADRYLHSWLWWRRALALRALGLTQIRNRTASVVAALDDRDADVRAAALDALVDLKDRASLQAVVVRLHDATLPRGRRVAALTAFGSQCEQFLLDLAHVDPANRLNYARALAVCGTDYARPTLCRWTRDTRSEVRTAAFEALRHVGLDAHAAALAIESLQSRDSAVRAMAAFALRGWTGSGNAAPHLARRLDDTWNVAVQAARSLQSMGPAGLAELQAYAARADSAGLLARQMLWERSVA